MTGSPRALRKLNGISSSPSAELAEQLARVAVISSIVVDCLTIKGPWLTWDLMSDRSAGVIGKNLSLSIATLEL